jgi:ubiquitin-activating enzyme E1
MGIEPVKNANSRERPIQNVHHVTTWGLSKSRLSRILLGEVARRSLTAIRGGDADSAHVNTDKKNSSSSSSSSSSSQTKERQFTSKKKDNDDERYSRQMYALGARAHGLVRSTTAILDGPMGKIIKSSISQNGEHGFRSLHPGQQNGKDIPSGLLYEMAKNLALSGVGRIILVRNDDGFDAQYFDGTLDDLGAAYHRAALAEVFPESEKRAMNERDEDEMEVEDEDFSDEMDDEKEDGAVLLAEYIQRLNPGVQVDILTRAKILELLRGENQDDEDWDDENTVSLGSNPVMVCIDRSVASMLEVNDACRFRCQTDSQSVPFVSVKTAGVYSQLFCDFGPSFVVVDEDGETPRSTLIDNIEIDDENNQIVTVNCLDGERHDVSSGDLIEFQGESGPDEASSGGSFPRCEVVVVKSPACFTVKVQKQDESKEESLLNTLSLSDRRTRSFTRVKVPRTISFSSLREILQPDSHTDDDSKAPECWDNDKLFAPSDLDKSFDPQRRKAIMASMAALDKFVTKYGRLPNRSSKELPVDGKDESVKAKRSDVERFQSLVRKVSNTESSASLDKIVTQFASTCRAKFIPLQAIAGAVGAQEVLKAATGLYNPVRQFLLYDCDEVLESCDANSKYSDLDDYRELVAKGQTYILGNELSQKLASSRIFLVGAGAIGCELLKNLASMGAGTSKQGCLIVTDMDTIEKSNLSRQLLFRDIDVGEFKSAAAKASVLRFSNCNVEAHTSRVGDEEDGPFDDDFWSTGCDVVLNALDNVEARLFVDSQCVSNGRGLIDAGTLGPKGNVQVVVPHLSESYGSSSDPPEPDIPVCTLKNFPYDISHTIQWARDLFDGYFNRRPRQANDHVAEIAQMEDLTDFAHMLIRKFGEDAAVDMSEELGEDLGVFPFAVGLDSNDPEYIASVKMASLKWAIRHADRLFYTTIVELLKKHPADSLDEDGAPFWTGSRRVPSPLKFTALNAGEDEVSAQQVVINESIAQFVQFAARLRMESFLASDQSEEESSHTLVSLEDALSSLEKHASVTQDKKEQDADKERDVLAAILEKLNGAKTGASFLPKLNLVDFEKDDETNGHVSFVTAASNLRAMAYGIPTADAMETRRVAGRIVPAMITTTGLVSALSCLELIKMLKGLPLVLHRNAFVNLALPFFAFTCPLPADQVSEINGKTFTMWDRIVVKGSNKAPADTMTLKKFIDKVKKQAQLGDDMEISNISYGPYMIYANFLNSEDEELLGSPLMDTVKSAVISEEDSAETGLDEGVEEAGCTKLDDNLTEEQKAVLSKLSRKRYLDFSVAVELTETGEEYELPPIRFIREKIDPK